MTVAATLRPLTLLFISSFLLMISHGLSGILLPVSLAQANVSVQLIGFILSMYSVGFLVGAIAGKRILRNIGLVRTFAMCGSLAASAILIMGLSSEVWLWTLMRTIMGFCIACATTTLDTWYSSVSSESNRGKILAINQIVILSAITLGQFGLILAPPGETLLFILCGVLFSISVTPVVFLSQFEPQIEHTDSISLSSLYGLSPLGFATCLVCGILYSTVANMMPVYAAGIGMTGLQLSLFMGAATTGGILLQWPVGYLSDRFERRKIILGTSFFIAVVSFLLPVSIEWAMAAMPLVLVAIALGLIACLYPLSISETFDRSVKGQLVPVLSGLLCLYAIGSIAGPYTASVLMEHYDNSAVFIFLMLTSLSLVVFTIYRMSVRDALSVEEQENFVMHTPATINGELDPRTEYQENSPYVEEVLGQVEALATSQPANAIKFIRQLATKQPQWAVSIAERAAQLDNIDTVVLFRALTLTNSDLSIDIARRLAESDDNQIEELVEWLVDKEPENAMSILAVISESMDCAPAKVVETLVENDPDKLVEFSQELVANLVENSTNLRPADREDYDLSESAEEWLNAVSETAPEQVEEITEIFEQSIQDTECDSNSS
ncbi:MFS transporter [Vibrio ostreicida]|uniref:MFS transporter n=1 Tax=Vibrio ostreicida TaxID=526588 RepID=UPI003B5B53BB